MNGRIRMAAVLILVSGVFIGAGARGNGSNDSWVGEMVLPIKQCDTFIKLPIMVRGEKDGKLQIDDGKNDAWAAKADFVFLHDAQTHFTQRIKDDPKDSWAIHMRAIAWVKAGNLDNALKDIGEAIQLDPTNPMVFFRRGLILAKKSDFDKAMLNPKLARAFNDRGSLWYHIDEKNKAILDFDEAIRLEPNESSFFINRGRVWFRLSQDDKAMRDYDEAIRLNSKDADAFFSRGLVWFENKDFNKALLDFHQAIRFDPKFGQAFYAKARSYAQMGQNERAIDNLRQSLELGYTGIVHFTKDSAFEAIRNDSSYHQLIKEFNE